MDIMPSRLTGHRIPVVISWVLATLLILSCSPLPSGAPDAFFGTAYREITEQLDGKRPLNFKRAVFLVENAYCGGTLSYKSFCDSIDGITDILKRMEKPHPQKSQALKQNVIFWYMKQPSEFNGYNQYKYNFSDPFAIDDYKHLFVSTLLSSRIGNCQSLPYLYKILADEQGLDNVHLSLAPKHVFIKTFYQNNWMNVELTKSFGNCVHDSSYIREFQITPLSLRTGIYLRPLSDMDCIVLCLSDLAECYWKKYGFGDFGLLCCDKALSYDPKNISALHVKSVILKNRLKEALEEDVSCAAKRLESYGATEQRMQQLGYRNWSEEEIETMLMQIDSMRISQE